MIIMSVSDFIRLGNLIEAMLTKIPADLQRDTRRGLSVSYMIEAARYKGLRGVSDDVIEEASNQRGIEVGPALKRDGTEHPRTRVLYRSKK